MERKNKSIKIHGNTYRKDADSVPCRRYRDYRGDYQKDTKNYIPGIVITPDHGSRIINYPEQHIANGRKKITIQIDIIRKWYALLRNEISYV